MVSPRFNLIEKLSFTSNQKLSKDSAADRKRSFDHGDIPGVFRNMYDTANAIASREGLIWVQVKHAQDTVDKLKQHERDNTSELDDDVLHPLVQTQLWEYVCKRRDELMQQMTELLELYAKSKWGGKQ